MELAIKIFLVIALGLKAVSAIYSVGEDREPVTATDVVWSFLSWAMILYMVAKL